MKIAVSAKGDTPEALVEPNFGESSHFLIYDTESGSYRAVPNRMREEPEAGIRTVEMLKEEGVEAIVTGNLGPNALQAIAAAGMECRIGAGGTVKDAVEAYLRGELSPGTYAGGGFCPSPERETLDYRQIP
ncbi:NifB/NifX family molybdenum-iron cluster-binding protein [Ammonifex thiophilus]|uniref:Dinitrogenase iron-molybdenum cofactor biosynthesis protein n=1 Tax=Ammonifex thiophilus TaxID=444093 RepID=A0A3D8P1M6_9THEO|nr:NifB/NifX family molybdenum-iron cluster-binding protein [Ammonifex thiophilus]RDV81711.1 dinitrogenase iron-molybdenum cofactor biosynthesis protein [Ammonifex thiophilus]